MAFQFNFFASNNDAGEAMPNERKSDEEAVTGGKGNLQYGGKVHFSLEMLRLLEANRTNEVITMEGIRLLVPSAQHQKLEVNTSYGGGFKVWESTIDLVHYLRNNTVINHQQVKEWSNHHGAALKILDLGCGLGVLGITCGLLFPNCNVTFQDLNYDVIVNSTWLNLLLNFPASSKEEGEGNQRFELVYGSWGASLCGNVLRQGEGAYDLVVASEVLYYEASYDDLISTLLYCLKQKGVCFLASKTYYFGCGGGTASFIKLIENNYKQSLRVTVVKKIMDGTSNVREILEIVKL